MFLPIIMHIENYNGKLLTTVCTIHIMGVFVILIRAYEQNVCYVYITGELELLFTIKLSSVAVTTLPLHTDLYFPHKQ